MNARIDICCNDPDNGNFAGRAEGIQIGSEFIELEPRGLTAPRFVLLDGAFRLAGKRWPFSTNKDWYGNWCWNAYWMPIPVAVDFLAWLHGRRLFQLTTGETRIYNRWKARRHFDASDRAWLTRELGKPSNWSAA